jgi:hypothetical protein
MPYWLQGAMLLDQQPFRTHQYIYICKPVLTLSGLLSNAGPAISAASTCSWIHTDADQRAVARLRLSMCRCRNLASSLTHVCNVHVVQVLLQLAARRSGRVHTPGGPGTGTRTSMCQPASPRAQLTCSRQRVRCRTGLAAADEQDAEESAVTRRTVFVCMGEP